MRQSGIVARKTYASHGDAFARNVRLGVATWAAGTLPLLFLLFFLNIPAVADAQEQGIRGALQAGRFEDVLSAMDAQLKEWPADPQLWFVRGLALQGLGRSKESLASFEHSLSLAPHSAAALHGAAQAAFQLRDARAQALLERVLTQQPNDLTAHAMAGTLAYERHECPAAAGHFAKGLNVVNDSPPALAEYGDCLLQNGEPGRAVPVFERWVHLAPDQPSARYDLGFAQYESKQFQEAAATLAPLTTATSTDSDAMNLQAAALVESNDVQQAIDLLRRATIVAPKDRRNYLDLATVCMDHNASDLALEVLNTGLQNLPSSPELFTVRGAVKAQVGQMDQAQNDFEQAARLQPDALYGTVGLGMLLRQTDRLDEAAALVRQRLNNKPNDPVLNYLLADVLLRAGAIPGQPQFNDAQASLERAVNARPNFPQAHALLGKLYLKLDRKDQAAGELNLSIRQDPGNRAALNQLILVLRQLGRNDEAAVAAGRLRDQLAQERKDESDRNRLRLIKSSASASEGTP